MQIARRVDALGRAPCQQRRVAKPARQPLLVRAVQQQQEKPPAPGAPPPRDKKETKIDALLEDLKKTGMTNAKAKEVLKKWKEAGVNDGESLRKILIRRSLMPLQGLGIQTIMDSVAACGGWYVASLGSQATDQPFGLVVQLLGYFFALYYTIQILFELTLISSILYSSYKYGTSSSELMLAVQQLAGPGTGVSVVDTAQRAINTVKVIQALEALSVALKETFGDAQGSTLSNLSAMMTLKHAKETYGFNPEDYELTEKQASNIALAFATYDLNDNGKLDLFELGKLCEDLGSPLNDEELKEAMRQLDQNNNRMIEFNEFVAWWQGRTKGGPSPA